MPFFKSLAHDAGPPVIHTQYLAIYEPRSQIIQATWSGSPPLTQGDRKLIVAYPAGNQRGWTA